MSYLLLFFQDIIRELIGSGAPGNDLSPTCETWFDYLSNYNWSNIRNRSKIQNYRWLYQGEKSSQSSHKLLSHMNIFWITLLLFSFDAGDNDDNGVSNYIFSFTAFSMIPAYTYEVLCIMFVASTLYFVWILPP